MIGSCDCCDRQYVPVSKFSATAAYPEGVACFLCQGDDDLDPYGELEDSSSSPTCQKCGEPTKYEMAEVAGEIWCHPCADNVQLPSTECGSDK